MLKFPKRYSIIFSLTVIFLGLETSAQAQTQTNYREIQRYIGNPFFPYNIHETLIPPSQRPEFRYHKERICIPHINSFNRSFLERYQEELIKQVKYFVKVDYCLIEPFVDSERRTHRDQSFLDDKLGLKPLHQFGVEGNKFAIQRINVSGFTALSNTEVDSELRKYLSPKYQFEDLIELTSAVTFLYAKKGLITSYGYLEKESINPTNGILKIRVVESGLKSIEYEKLNKKERQLINDRLELISLKPLNVFHLAYLVEELRTHPTLVNLEAQLKATKDLEYGVKLLFTKNRQLLKENAEQYYEKALEDLAQEKLSSALENLDKAIEINPLYSKAKNKKAEIYVENNQWSKALSSLNDILHWRPNDAISYKNRATLYQLQKKWELAITDYNKALELDPEFAEAYGGRGIVFSELGKLELALEDYNKALELNSNLTEIYNNRGFLYKKKKQYSLAIRDFNKAINLNPNLARAYENRGLVYAEQKLFSLALKDFTKAIKLEPNNPEHYNNRAVAYEKIDQKLQALKDYNSAIIIDPKHALSYRNRGIFFARFTTFYKKARLDLQKALELFKAQNKTEKAHEVEAILNNFLSDNK